MTEIEAKFLLHHPEQSAEVLRTLADLGCRITEGTRLAISDRYVDTEDWRVLRAGWACRRRRQDDGSELTLKSVNGGDGPVFTREEVSQSLQRKWKPGRKLPQGTVREHLAAALDGHAPREIFRLHTDRHLYDVLAPGEHATTIELAVDHTTIRGGRKKPRRLEFTEIELELRDGDAAVIEILARELDGRVGLLGARLSKFERGLQAAGIESPALDKGVKLTRKSPMLDLACASLARNLRKLIVNEPRAWEGLHPEGVHQMRVAIRRLRAALKTFHDLLPADWCSRLNHELRWLARTLGAVRDSDVYDENFETYLAALPDSDAHALANYQTHLLDINRHAREHLLEVLASERYRLLLHDFGTFLSEGPSAGRQRRFGGLTIGYGAGPLVRKPIDKMLTKGEEIDDSSPDEMLHKLRILGKRVRYQGEFFAEFYPKSLQPLLKASRQLQDVLGEHQDAAVACERLRLYADTVPTGDAMRKELLALGRLVQTQTLHGEEERARFPKYWRRFARAAQKTNL